MQKYQRKKMVWGAVNISILSGLTLFVTLVCSSMIVRLLYPQVQGLIPFWWWWRVVDWGSLVPGFLALVILPTLLITAGFIRQNDQEQYAL